MCMDHTIRCSCGHSAASFNFRDELMPVAVVNRLYCPKCSGEVPYDASAMLRDNDWIIEYDMDVARFKGQCLPSANITPDYLFDEGYCTWRGVYPTDHSDSVREREELVRLSKTDQKKYLAEFRKWGISRMDRLSKEGWRKACEN